MTTIAVSIPTVHQETVSYTQLTENMSSFIERNILTITFVASCILMTLYTPGVFLVGATIGALGEHVYHFNMGGNNTSIMPAFFSCVGIVGAFASLIKNYQPQTSLVFRTVPLCAAILAGNYIYRQLAPRFRW